MITFIVISLIVAMCVSAIVGRAWGITVTTKDLRYLVENGWQIVGVDQVRSPYTGQIRCVSEACSIQKSRETGKRQKIEPVEHKPYEIGSWADSEQVEDWNESI